MTKTQESRIFGFGFNIKDLVVIWYTRHPYSIKKPILEGIHVDDISIFQVSNILWYCYTENKTLEH